jgi:hypothetical protein
MAIPPETGFLAFAGSFAPTDGSIREELFRIVTTCPPDAPAWQDFGLDAQEFWDELQGIEPFDLGEGLRTFYRLYAKKQNKPRYGDKTPIYCEYISSIERALPEAHFIHIIRDGRDTALSLRRMWFAPAQDIQTLALYWQRLVRSAREAGLHSRAYMEVRYEELVMNPQPVLEAVCKFAKLDFDPAMLRYWDRTPDRLKEHRTRHRMDGSVVVTHSQRLVQQRLTMQPPQAGRIFGWKEEMTRDEHSEFLRCAGYTLKELGYEV